MEDDADVREEGEAAHGPEQRRRQRQQHIGAAKARWGGRSPAETPLSATRRASLRREPRRGQSSASSTPNDAACSGSSSSFQQRSVLSGVTIRSSFSSTVSKRQEALTASGCLSRYVDKL